jgi:hypothetical protein
LPRLLLFAPCERVLIDRFSNAASLIGVVQDLRFDLPVPERIPRSAKFAFPWQLFALWLREPEDEGKRFEQLCELVLPDGEVAMQARATFSLDKRTHRQIMAVPGFAPAKPWDGECRLRLSVREDAEGSHWHSVAEYPILLQFAQSASRVS